MQIIKQTIITLWVKIIFQKINNTTIYAEKMHYRNFADPGKKFVLSLHYNGNTVICMLMVIKN